jgi:cell division protease FtsH
MNEAAIVAVLKKREAVAQEDLEEARDKVRFGRQKKSRVIAEEDKLVTARHEAGHAVAAALLPNAEPVHKVTIIPRGMALGTTMFLPDRDRHSLSKKRAEDELSVLYGGRIAEEVLGEDISAGASNDIARATELARLMVCEWGFSSRIGPLRYGEKVGSEFLGTEFAASRFHSEPTAREIDEEVRRICSEAYDRTKQLLEERRADLQRVAEALLQHETITGLELKAILAGQSLETLRPEAPGAGPAAASSAPKAKTRPDARAAVDPGLSEPGLAPA